MLQDKHENRCIDLLGSPYPEVHIFLDQYFSQFRSRFHRCALHHQRGIDLADHYPAAEILAAAELHIMDDLSRIPTDWNDMDNCWMPTGDEDN